MEQEKGLNDVQRIVWDFAHDDGAERSKISSFNFLSFVFVWDFVSADEFPSVLKLMLDC